MLPLSDFQGRTYYIRGDGSRVLENSISAHECALRSLQAIQVNPTIVFALTEKELTYLKKSQDLLAHDRLFPSQAQPSGEVKEEGGRLYEQPISDTKFQERAYELFLEESKKTKWSNPDLPQLINQFNLYELLTVHGSIKDIIEHLSKIEPLLNLEEIRSNKDFVSVLIKKNELIFVLAGCQLLDNKRLAYRAISVCLGFFDKTDTPNQNDLLVLGLCATVGGHVEILKQLWSLGLNLSKTNNSGRTIAYQAAVCGHIEVLQYLYGINPDLLTQVNDKGLTVAHLAAHSGQVHILEYLHGLRELDSSLFSQLYLGAYKPVHMAAARGQIEVLEWFYRQDSNLLQQGSRLGLTAAHLAARYGLEKTLEYLYSKDPSLLRQTDASGHSVVHMAAARGQIEVLDCLYRLDPSLLDQIDAEGGGAFHCAAVNGKTTVLQYLQSKGLDLNTPTRGGETVLSILVRKNEIHKINFAVRELGLKITKNFIAFCRANRFTTSEETMRHLELLLYSPWISNDFNNEGVVATQFKESILTELNNNSQAHGSLHGLFFQESHIKLLSQEVAKQTQDLLGMISEKDICSLVSTIGRIYGQEFKNKQGDYKKLLSVLYAEAMQAVENYKLARNLGDSHATAIQIVTPLPNTEDCTISHDEIFQRTRILQSEGVLGIQVYERENILRWVATAHTDPITRVSIDESDIIPFSFQTQSEIRGTYVNSSVEAPVKKQKT